MRDVVIDWWLFLGRGWSRVLAGNLRRARILLVILRGGEGRRDGERKRKRGAGEISDHCRSINPTTSCAPPYRHRADAAMNDWYLPSSSGAKGQQECDQ